MRSHAASSERQYPVFGGADASWQQDVIQKRLRARDMPPVLVWDRTLTVLAVFIVVVGPYLAVNIENAKRHPWDQRPFPPLGTTLFTPVVHELRALVADALRQS